MTAGGDESLRRPLFSWPSQHGKRRAL